MSFSRKKIIRTGIILFLCGLALVLIIAGILIVKTWGRTLIQVDIHQNKELIYTDRFVKITTEDQIVQGYGLESDPRLSRRRIKNLSATIYINEEE